VLILPIAVENRTVAVLQVCRAVKAAPFSLDHRDVGQLFADNVAAVIDRARVMEGLRESTSAIGVATPAESATPAGVFRDSFLTAATAELKSPLTTIVAYSEVLDQNERKMTPSMRLEFTARLRSEAQRMMNLVEDVLDVVRLELGRYLMELTVSNVNEAVRSAMDAVRPLAEIREISLEMSLDQNIPDQHMDPGKLRQAVLSLIRNGIRFSPPKGRVRVATWLRDDSVTIEIRDSGPPVPPETAALFFDLEQAVSGEMNRCKDGLGFGLHLAKRFVELHGGAVSAGSDSGSGGATFWIRLPRDGDLARLVGADPFVEELAKR
jgi:signal transduction histidine kinase